MWLADLLLSKSILIILTNNGKYLQLLEKGPSVVQLPVLNIIHCMLHYVDLSSVSSQPFNCDLLVTIAKFIEVRNLVVVTPYTYLRPVDLFMIILNNITARSSS